jgi:hypothetical protein
MAFSFQKSRAFHEPTSSGSQSIELIVARTNDHTATSRFIHTNIFGFGNLESSLEESVLKSTGVVISKPSCSSTDNLRKLIFPRPTSTK